MTDAGWAEKKVRKEWDTYSGDLEDFAASLLKAEHAHDVRIVKKFIKQYAADRDLIERQVAERILTALQRGRGGKG